MQNLVQEARSHLPHPAPPPQLFTEAPHLNSLRLRAGKGAPIPFFPGANEDKRLRPDPPEKGWAGMDSCVA